MSCDFCTPPGKLADCNVVFVWPPQGHTRHKLVKYLGEREIAFENQSEENCVIVETGDVQKLLVAMCGLFTAGEALDSRVLITDRRQPSLGAFGDLHTLDGMMARVRGDWLIALLEEKRYMSYAQPIVSAVGEHAVVGHEFLFRGIDEDGKILAPDTLFDSARDPRLFFNLDRAARISAVDTASRMATDTDVFINFMPGSVYDPGVCLRTTVQAAAESGLSPQRVVFEIVESQRIEDMNHLRGIVNFYRAAGFRIALDDFGAGNSNMEVYLALKPDFVKLDKSLTQNLVPGDERINVVGSLIQTFHSTGIQVVAEGIETEENAKAVIACGTDRMQGYYFGRPGPVA